MINLPKNINPVAYFCVEFGIDNELPTYAGGLGILAGEVISAAADINFPMIGIGLLHKGRKFVQHIDETGYQHDLDSVFDPNTSFLRETTINGKPLIIEISCGETIKVRSYYIRLADHTLLFFLSPNVDGNSEDWRGLLNTIYWGDEDTQIKQNILLGVGGVKLLEALKIKPSFYHLNEGRPAFVVTELIKHLSGVDKKDVENSWNLAQQSIVYTNHTLVKAGNVSYDPQKVRHYLELIDVHKQLDINFIIEKGIEQESKRFDMTRFALNASHKVSAVSKAHGKISKKLWPNYNWYAITNGVHLPRWQTHAFRNTSIHDRDLWDNHVRKKADLSKMVLNRTGFKYDHNRLVVTWARRVAGYKQPKAVISDLNRLVKIITRENKAIQLLFAGKVHPGDDQNKLVLQEIIRYMQNELSGYAIFVPDYDISLAKSLVSGSDIWLNTPKPNEEASGTSGMKALSNGVLNMTTVGGWAKEVNWENVGWKLDDNNLSASIYSSLEEAQDIYYETTGDYPKTWVERMRKSIELSKNFTADRMLKEYVKYLYS
ncbi:alpha-glucan family phosphorylase [Candidatus Woesebacteria bacterium]|nr:MAG: alpha-glucan family phosphorylase [Candidatus Woesebacteria bacterium]